jgi:flagellar FliJ protein
MSKFRFRLASLLRIREAARDEQRNRLAEALRAEEVLSQRLDELASELVDLHGQYRQAKQTRVLDVDRLIDVQRYELVLLTQEQVLRQQAEALAQEVDRRRQALMAADQEVRMLEKLRETQAARHRAGDERQEGKQMDEVAARVAAGREND